MAKLYDKDGNEVEAFTADELKGKQDEAVQAYLKDHPDQSQALKDAEQKAADLQKQIDEGGLSEGQKKRLIEERDAATKSVKDLTDQFRTEMNTFKESVFSGVKNKALDALSGGKKDVREKIEAKYTSLMKTGEYATDEAGITTALREAATIVNGAKPAPGIMDGITSVRAAEPGNGGEKPAVEESANSKAMRAAFGITDQTAAKFAPKS